jgi:flagellar hook assembly protein FlgD
VAPAPQDAAQRAPGAARVTTTAPELLTNLYTGQDGYAHFQLPALTQGTLSVTVTDDDANQMSDQVSVTSQAGVGAAAPGALRLSAMPSVTRGTTLIGFGRALYRSATISLRDIAGREVRSLAVAGGAQSVRWDGTDASGARVANGLYFAHLSNGLAGGTARIIVLH